MTLIKCGWRQPSEEDTPGGLDHLGLAAPIEYLAGHLTPAITNATRRVRYFSFVPWIYWRYAQLRGRGTAKDQRDYVKGMETLFAYANIASGEQWGRIPSHIIRRIGAKEEWDKAESRLPLRTMKILTKPSPMEPANYGPSIERLDLVRRNAQGGLTACRPYGIELSKRLDVMLRKLPQYREMPALTLVSRQTVKAWSRALCLDSVPEEERTLLRALFFGFDPFPDPAGAQRTLSLLLCMELAMSADTPFGHYDIEFALASGTGLTRSRANWDELLAPTALSWRILVLLNIQRYAAELAFHALRQFISAGGRWDSAAQAADALAESTAPLLRARGARTLERLAEQSTASHAHGAWYAQWGDVAAEENVVNAVVLSAWVFRQIDQARESVLASPFSERGRDNGCSLLDYRSDFDAMRGSPLRYTVLWLLKDRALARHLATAASKIHERDTYRILEDELGVRTVGAYGPTAGGVHTLSMLWLLSDLGVLVRDEEGSFRAASGLRSFCMRVRRSLQG